MPAAVDVELQWLTATMRKCTCETTASKSEHVFAKAMGTLGGQGAAWEHKLCSRGAQGSTNF